MAGLEIGLIVVGILIFAGSFFVTEKLSSSDMKEITKISEDEVKSIVNKQIEKSEETINERLQMRLDDAVSDFAVRTDDEYVAKMNQMNEYSEKVLSTMEKTNNEIVFIHSMLTDKQETVADMATQLDVTKSQLLQLKSDVDKKLDELKEQYEENLELKKKNEFESGIEAARVEKETVKTFEDELIDRISDENMNAPDSFKDVVMASPETEGEEKRLDDMLNHESNEKTRTVSTMSDVEEEIIKLHKEGYSEIDIAKRFGKGIGEIKLILGLYN